MGIREFFGFSAPPEQQGNGTFVWRHRGQLHRDEGPAIITKDGLKEWYYYGQWHRVGGPAIDRPDGSQVWYRHDKKHREDGPAVLNADGTREWWQNGKLHREDGPAIERADGAKEWLFDGLPHREDGPCTIDRHGQPFAWAIHGKLMSQPEHDEYRASKIPASMALTKPHTLSAPKLKFGASR